MCMLVHMSVSVCMHVPVCVHMCMSMLVFAYENVHVREKERMHVCVNVYVCA